MFGLFRKKGKDQYLLKVASILHDNIGPELPLENAYNLAEESLNELRGNISKGMFKDGANPKENIMAYYSLCSMLNESGAADDKMAVFKISIMTRVLKEKLGDSNNMSPLEKGICQFGEHVLSEDSSAPKKEDVAKIKLNAVKIIMALMEGQDVIAPLQDVTTIVDNVSSDVGDRAVLKVGEHVLAVSVLSNAAGYFIDQGKTDMAYSYYTCIRAAMDKHFEGQMDSYSDYQKNSLRVIIQGYISLGEEFMSK